MSFDPSGIPNLHAETLALHAGQTPDPTTRARAVPIYQTTIYVFKDSDHAANLFGLKEFGNIYTRIMNPTTDVFEQRIAALEGGVGALALASGQAAETLSILNLAWPATTSSRRATCTAAPTTCSTTPCPARHHVQVRRLHATLDASATPSTTRPRPSSARPSATRASMSSTSEAIADVAHAKGVPVIVDTTFAPLLVKPFEHGADIVVHSATKCIGGHGTASAASSSTAASSTGPVRAVQPSSPTRIRRYHGLSLPRAPSAPLAFILKLRVQACATSAPALSPFNAFLFLQGSRRCRCAWSATARTRWRSPTARGPSRGRPGSATRASRRTRPTSSAAKHTSRAASAAS